MAWADHALIARRATTQPTPGAAEAQATYITPTDLKRS